MMSLYPTLGKRVPWIPKHFVIRPADYLDEVAQKADADQADRTMGIEALFAVAAYALYRLAKNYCDHQRALAEAELRDQMLDQVEGLVQRGWNRDKALASVLQVSKEISTLRSDSAIVKAAMTILGKNNPA
jgi:hypothetical protein